MIRNCLRRIGRVVITVWFVSNTAANNTGNSPGTRIVPEMTGLTDRAAHLIREAQAIQVALGDDGSG